MDPRAPGARRPAAPTVNHQINEPDLVDVFPYTDRIVDLASVQPGDAADAPHSLYIEISHPWPPNEANLLDPATWRLELLVCGDNIRPQRSFVTVTFDGTWPDPGSAAIWEHLLVDGPSQDGGPRHDRLIVTRC
jgi:hypothetical protein